MSLNDNDKLLTTEEDNIDELEPTKTENIVNKRDKNSKISV